MPNRTNLPTLSAMGRVFAVILLAAISGSFLSTVMLSVVAGGTGGVNPLRIILAFTAATMIFTVPGAAVIFALRAMLIGEGLKPSVAYTVLPVIGAALGGAILGFIDSMLSSAGVGAFYGFVTASLVIVLDQLIRPLSRSRP